MSGAAVSRRWFIKTATGAGGALVIGIPVRPDGPPPGDGTLSPFVTIRPDGIINFTIPEAEMGQGVTTALAQVLAEELDAAWDSIRISLAKHDAAFYDENGVQSTGDSRTVRSWYTRLRVAGAAARSMLVNAAAERWNVPAAACRTSASLIYHDATARSVTYAELASAAASREPPASPQLKDPSSFELIGRPMPRLDTPLKVTGAAQFGADVRLPGQLFAAVRMSRGLHGEVSVLNAGEAGLQPGVVGVFDLGTAIAAVAEGWWLARQALDQVKIKFLKKSSQIIDNKLINDHLANRVTEGDGVVVTSRGDVNEAMRAAVLKVQASYHVPYLPHLCMETMNATVWVRADSVIAHAPTQSPQRFAGLLSQWTGIPVERVTMHNTYLGGGLGRKGLDYAALQQATELSKRTSRPVQVIWDRESDIQHDQFRPAAHYSLAAALDESAKLTALDARIGTQSLRRTLFPDYYKRGTHEPPTSYSLHDFAYATDNLRVQWHEAELPIPVGYWRAVGRSNCPFATESFIDELAHAAGEDPLNYRRRHLLEKGRHVAVLDAVATAADWGRPRGNARGLGIAVQDGWGSVCAQVAQVAATERRLEVEQIWAAVDCGRVVNPDIVRAQIESGILDALAAALEGGIRIADGAVAHSNFNDYPVMRMPQIPPVSVTLVESDAPPGGVGELGVPACAPAVANALFAATGYRARSLPLSRHAPFRTLSG